MAKKKGKKLRLSAQQVILLRELAKGKSLTEAGRTAGFADNGYVGQIAHQSLESVKEKMPAILDRLGLTADVAIETYLKPLLVAEETEFAHFKGEITDSINVVAWGPRATGLDMLFKLRGSYAPKEITGADGGPVPVVIDTGGMRKSG